MSRIPLVEVEDLTPAQLEIYNTPSGKLNLYRLLAQATTVVLPYLQVTKAIFAELDIPPTERELIVLAVLHLEQGSYEWAQHVQIAEDMGIPQNKIEEIGKNRFNSAVFDIREKSILAFTRQVVKSVRVDDYVFSAISEYYSSRQIVEAIYTIGSYMMVLRISEVAELELDGVHGASVVRDAVARSRAEAAISGDAFRDPD